MSRLQGWLTVPLLGCSLLFAGAFFAGVVVLHDLRPVTASAARFVVATWFLGAGVLLRRGQRPWPTLRQWIWLAVGGTLGIAGYQTFFFLALEATSPTNAALILAACPVLTAVLGRVLIRETVRVSEFMRVLLVSGGVGVLVTGGDIEAVMELRFGRGECMMLSAISSWAVYTLIVRRLSVAFDATALTFFVTLAGTVILISASLTENPTLQVASASWPTWAAVAYMGIFATGIGYRLYNVSVERLGPTRTAACVYALVPLWVGLLSWIVSGEEPSALAAMSAVLILGGLLISPGSGRTVFHSRGEPRPEGRPNCPRSIARRSDSKSEGSSVGASSPGRSLRERD